MSCVHIDFVDESALKNLASRSPISFNYGNLLVFQKSTSVPRYNPQKTQWQKEN